jgi:hypothetical protein
VSLYARIALGLAVFLGGAGVVYGVTGHEFVGTPLLLIASACFAYLGIFARRAVRTAVAEAGDGDHAQDVAEPHVGPTIWPFVFSLAGVGLTLGAVVSRWLLVVGAVLFVMAAVGWFVDVARQWGHAEHP